MAESVNYLKAKYSNIHLLLIADSNRLNLDPIIGLLPQLSQVVTVPTRLNPPATLDTIITTLSKYYKEPYTKPPIASDKSNGKPSDHLVVLYEPKFNPIQHKPRKYKRVQYRPLPDSGIAFFGTWLKDQNWNEIYQSDDINYKAEFLQHTLMSKFYKFYQKNN